MFYINKLQNDHINLSVINSGLIINPCFPFIGASPDDIIHCDCCGTGVLEIKCPYSITQNKQIENLACILNGKLKKTPISLSDTNTYAFMCVQVWRFYYMVTK